MSATKYYQVGGFRPQVRWYEGDWNDEKLLKTLAGQESPLRPSIDRPIELVLGIGPKGTSHLLLADTQIRAFERAGTRRTNQFTTMADYVSVSPIWFDSADALGQKLKSLKPKKRKGKKDEPWDTSPANKSFTSGNQGLQRGEFENGRVLYHLVRNDINPLVYSVPDATWASRLRVVSFVCNLRLIDERPYDVKQHSPQPLDYGWAEADVLHPGVTFKQESAVHIIRSEDRTLQAGRGQVSFEHGTTQILEWKSIVAVASQFFRTLQKSQDPVILLVHNGQLALRALRELGVLVSEWKHGISELLRGQGNAGASNRRAVEASSSQFRTGRHDSNSDDYKNKSRDRSRSPTRTRAGVGPGDVMVQSRMPSPPHFSSRSAKVYIVDVQELFRAMTQSQSDQHAGDLAQKLGVIQDGDAWCAGNEAVYLLKAWHSMISGLSIDEQRTLRAATPNHNQEKSITRLPIHEPGSIDDISDEEFDPNDIVPEITNTAQGSQTGKGSISYETDWSSDDD